MFKLYFLDAQIWHGRNYLKDNLLVVRAGIPMVKAIFSNNYWYGRLFEN